MKQRTIFPLLAMAALVGLAACSSDDELAQEPQQGEAVANFTVEVPGDFANTRTGYTNSKLSGYKNSDNKATIYLAMYRTTTDADGNKTVVGSPLFKESKEATDGKAAFTLKGVKGVPVKIVAFATVGDKKLDEASWNWDYTSIPIATSVRNSINKENEDCFFGSAEGTFGTWGMPESMELSRPSCKVRLIATDWPLASQLELTDVKFGIGSDGSGSSWTYAKSFNALAGSFEKGTARVQSRSYLSTPTLSYANEDETTAKTVYIQYFPASDEEEEVTLQFKAQWSYNGSSNSKSFTVKEVPLKRNRLVTLKGDIFTSTSDFTVSIEDGLDYPTTTPTADSEGNYTIGDEGSFSGLMDILNDDAASGVTTTIKLTDDLDLSKVSGSFPDIQLKGASDITIDGQGHTVKGLKKALFTRVYANQTITVKNITFEDASLEGKMAQTEEGSAGIIARWTESNGGNIVYTFDQVTVKNSSFTGAYWPGTLLGYVNTATVNASNCTIEGCTGDRLGGFLGYFEGAKATFEGCTVNNSSLSGLCVYRQNGGEVVVNNLTQSGNNVSKIVGYKEGGTLTVDGTVQ